MRILENAGYICSRVRGPECETFDVIAVHAAHTRLIRVRPEEMPLTEPEREQIAELQVSYQVTKEIWFFPRRMRRPRIEVLR